MVRSPCEFGDALYLEEFRVPAPGLSALARVEDTPTGLGRLPTASGECARGRSPGARLRNLAGTREVPPDLKPLVSIIT